MFKTTDKYGGHLQGYVQLVPAQLEALFGDRDGFWDDKYMEWYQVEDDDGHFATIYSKWTHPGQGSERPFRFNVGGYSHEDVLELVTYLKSEGLDVGDVDLFGVDVTHQQWVETQKAHAAVDAPTQLDVR